MNKNEIDAINALKLDLTTKLETEPVIEYLYVKQEITRRHYDTLKSLKSNQERCIQLLDIIINIDCPFSVFLDALSNAKQGDLRKELEIKAGIPVSEGQTTINSQNDYIADPK